MPRNVTRIRVAFVDVDSSQRIHYTAMFRYFEIAEHDLMRALDLPYSQGLHDYRFPRVHLDCDFRGAIHFDDLLDLEARVHRVGTTSWAISLAADGHMTIVALDPVHERPTPLPAELRAALESDVGDLSM